MPWQVLKGVGGGPSEPGPFEGIPTWLQIPLRKWARAHIGLGMNFDADVLIRAAVNLRLDLNRPNPGTEGIEVVFWSLINEHPDRLLQLVHYFAYQDAQSILEQSDFDGFGAERLRDLENLLEEGASVWTVDRDGSGLTRRVDATTKAQLAEVLTPNDAASEELREAWSNAYGFNPDPSDCWDHSIKAVEALLKPIVLPNKPDATVGHVVGELTANPGGHAFELQDQGLKNLTDSHQTLVGLLRLVWVNPDRHQGSDHRTPTISEARGVLAAAITIVQWVREGLIK